MPTKRGDFAVGIVADQLVCAGGLGQSSILYFIELCIFIHCQLLHYCCMKLLIIQIPQVGRRTKQKY